MSGGDWDFEHQRMETAWTVEDLVRKTGLERGTAIGLDLDFVPGDGADREAFVRKLAMFGYAVRGADPGAPAAVTVEVPDTAFDADAIWRHEETATKLALIHGYLPDGWGFWEP